MPAMSTVSSRATLRWRLKCQPVGGARGWACTRPPRLSLRPPAGPPCLLEKPVTGGRGLPEVSSLRILYQVICYLRCEFKMYLSRQHSALYNFSFSFQYSTIASVCFNIITILFYKLIHEYFSNLFIPRFLQSCA